MKISENKIASNINIFLKTKTNINAGKNIAQLWLSSLVSAGFAFLIQILLARTLEPESYGVFMAALIIITSLVPLVGFGVHSYWLKAFGNEGWKAMEWLPGSFKFLLKSSLIGICLIIFWAFIGGHDSITKIILLVLLPYLLGQMFLELVSAKFQLEERYKALAIWQMIPNMLRFVLVLVSFILIKSLENLISVAIIYSVVSFGVCLFGFFQLNKMKRGNFNLMGHSLLEGNKSEKTIITKKSDFFGIAKVTWPFGLASLFHLIYFQSDIVLIKYLTGSSEAGIYAVAFTIITATLLLPSVIYQKFLLPKLHRWSSQNRELFYNVYKKGNLLMLAIGIIVMIGILIASDWFIYNLFGSKYEQSISLLKVLSINIPILFIASSVGAVLVTQEHMKLKVKIMGAVALMNVVLNMLIIPKFGALGAACTTIISNVILLVFYYITAQKVVFKN